jgi:hypothetical protein
MKFRKSVFWNVRICIYGDSKRGSGLGMKRVVLQVTAVGWGKTGAQIQVPKDGRLMAVRLREVYQKLAKEMAYFRAWGRQNDCKVLGNFPKNAMKTGLGVRICNTFVQKRVDCAPCYLVFGRGDILFLGEN